MLYYGNATEPIIVDDTQLAHVKVVVTTKLRRNESFTLTWTHHDDSPGERTTLWLQPSIPLRFVFDHAEASQLDPNLLRTLAEQAHSAAGLSLELTADDAPFMSPVEAA
jgi:hypothetical protein